MTGIRQSTISNKRKIEQAPIKINAIDDVKDECMPQAKWK